MANKRIIKNYPSQATGILQDENMKWLAISSQIPINPIMKENSLIRKFGIKRWETSVILFKFAVGKADGHFI